MALDEPVRLVLCSDFDEVGKLTAACRHVAVDMPIGLPGPGQLRDCERAARRRLGPRRHSIFPTPPREFLEARAFSEVRGMSLQSFYLLPKIRELDRWISPELQLRVFEAHPELVFQRLAGLPLEHSKKTAAGRALRESLLGMEHTAPSWPLRLVQRDDVLDALALLRCAQEPGVPLGSDQRDERGLRMELYGLG